MSEPQFASVYDYGHRVASFQARRLLSTGVIAEHSIEDVQQDLMLHLFLRLPSYDASRASLNTFVSICISSEAVSIARKLTCCKRDVRKCRHSLDDETRTGGGFAISATVSELHDLRISIASVLVRLPARDRAVASHLQQCTPKECGRVLGLSRGAVYRSISRIRTALIAAGLGPSSRRSQ